jgi:L-threonylcarbamoyladenylate synthase
MISRRELSAALREEVLAGPAAEDSEGPVRSPGLLPRHYSPAVPLLLVASPERREGDFIVRLGAEFHASRDGVTLPDRAKDFASKLYFSLWLGEKSGAARIVFELPPDGAEWEAIHDRLKRAATPP